MELARRLAISRLKEGQAETVVAGKEECQALARRFGLLNVESLECSFVFNQVCPPRYMADGRLKARFHQECVISGEPMVQNVDAPFRVAFVPESEMVPDELLDIDALLAEERDEIPYAGRFLELGEAAAEQLGLEIPPYPRKDGAAFDERIKRETPSADAGGESGEENLKKHPFLALKRLKKGGPG